MRPLPPIISDMIEKLRVEPRESVRNEYAGRLRDVIEECEAALRRAGYEPRK